MKFTILSIGLVIWMSLAASHSLLADTLLVAEEFNAAAEDKPIVLAGILGRNNRGDQLRPVAEFNVAQARPEILAAESISVSFTVNGLTNMETPTFDGFDVVLLSDTDGVVKQGDYLTPGILIAEDIGVENLTVGQVFTFDVTGQLQAEALNAETDFVAFRIEIANGAEATTRQWINFRNNGYNVTSTLSIIAPVPEPSSAALLLGGLLLALYRTRK